jgi:hypothetical protein
MATIKTTPSKIKKTVESKDIGDPADQLIDMPSKVKTAEIERPDQTEMVAVVDEDLNSPNLSAYVKEMAFMKQGIDVIVGESTDPNAEQIVASGVNGNYRYFTRGKVYRDVPRMFIDSLLKRTGGVETEQYMDKQGVTQTRVNKSNAATYPISILKDPSGELGVRWFEWASGRNV